MWKKYNSQCDFCGEDDCEVYVESSSIKDGDDIRCVNCGAKGNLDVYSNGDTYCEWTIKGGLK